MLFQAKSGNPGADLDFICFLAITKIEMQSSFSYFQHFGRGFYFYNEAIWNQDKDHFWNANFLGFGE
jgi:hypothetical protein